MKHTRKLKLKKGGGKSRSSNSSILDNYGKECTKYFENIFKQRTIGHFESFETTKIADMNIFEYIVTHFRYRDENDFLNFSKIIADRVQKTRNSNEKIQIRIHKEFPVFIKNLQEIFQEIINELEPKHDMDWDLYWESRIKILKSKKEKTDLDTLFIHNKKFLLGLGNFLYLESSTEENKYFDFATSFSLNIYNLKTLLNRKTLSPVKTRTVTRKPKIAPSSYTKKNKNKGYSLTLLNVPNL